MATKVQTPVAETEGLYESSTNDRHPLKTTDQQTIVSSNNKIWLALIGPSSTQQLSYHRVIPCTVKLYVVIALDFVYGSHKFQTTFSTYVSTHLTPVEDLGMKLLCSTFATIT